MQNNTIIFGGKGELSAKPRELLLIFVIKKHFTNIFDFSIQIGSPLWKPLLSVILLINTIQNAIISIFCTFSQLNAFILHFFHNVLTFCSGAPKEFKDEEHYPRKSKR